MLKQTLWILPIFVLGLGQAGEDKVKADLKMFQGTWTLSALEVNGRDVPVDNLDGTTVTVEGDKYVVSVKEKKLECVIRLDPSKDPREIDMIFTEPGGAIKTHQGIYRFKDDTFQISRGLNPEQARSREFATWPDTNCFVVTWKKQP